MINIALLQSVLNIIWSVFSMLFVLYRFTSLFSYIYNFGKFLLKIGRGMIYIKDNVSTPSFFSRMKQNCYNYFRSNKQPQPEIIPLYNTHLSDIRINNFSDTDSEPPADFFQQQMYESIYDPNVRSDLFTSIKLN